MSENIERLLDAYPNLTLELVRNHTGSVHILVPDPFRAPRKPGAAPETLVAGALVLCGKRLYVSERGWVTRHIIPEEDLCRHCLPRLGRHTERVLRSTSARKRAQGE